MIGKAQRVEIPRAELGELCRRRGIRRLALFGSVLRDDFTPTSDIDVLVEFEPGRTPGLIGLGTIELELSALFGGRRIDLHTRASLHEGFRQHVLATAEVQFDGSP
ncbi:MAG: nucleotidyltransferase family protein [Pirellulales bacterium]|nr:nucleotidyltransferase family protein [Pirellulales bacterium]